MRKIYWLTLEVPSKVYSERQTKFVLTALKRSQNKSCVYSCQSTSCVVSCLRVCVCLCDGKRGKDRENRIKLIQEGCGCEISIQLCIHWIAATQTVWFPVHRTTETNAQCLYAARVGICRSSCRIDGYSRLPSTDGTELNTHTHTAAVTLVRMHNTLAVKSTVMLRRARPFNNSIHRTIHIFSQFTLRLSVDNTRTPYTRRTSSFSRKNKFVIRTWRERSYVVFLVAKKYSHWNRKRMHSNERKSEKYDMKFNEDERENGINEIKLESNFLFLWLPVLSPLSLETTNCIRNALHFVFRDIEKQAHRSLWVKKKIIEKPVENREQKNWQQLFR